MSDLQHSFSRFTDSGFGEGTNTTPPDASVPSINIGGSPASPASPVNDILGRSVDIKKQLSQSFHGHSASLGGGGGGISGGGVTKPKSRRSSVYHVKAEEGENSDNGADNDNHEGKEDQGIERKRRDNINEKIQELLTLIPKEYFQESAKDILAAAEAGSGLNGASSQSQQYEEALAMAKSTGTRDGKPNKGQILTQAVEYIQYLQNLIDENNRKEVELFLKMKTLQNQAAREPSAAANVPIAVEPTSAERALGEIGVGPESDQYFRNVLLESQGATRNES